MFDHRVLIHVVGLFRLVQRINKTPVGHFQAHIAFPGNNGTYRHIPFFFNQVNMFLCICIHAGRIRSGAVRFRCRINDDGLAGRSVCLKCSNTAGRAGQLDIVALYGQRIYGKLGKLVLYVILIDCRGVK